MKRILIVVGIIVIALVGIFAAVSHETLPQSEPRSYDELNCMQAPEKPGCSDAQIYPCVDDKCA